jgi:hypothetical protein
MHESNSTENAGAASNIDVDYFDPETYGNMSTNFEFSSQFTHLNAWVDFAPKSWSTITNKLWNHRNVATLVAEQKKSTAHVESLVAEQKISTAHVETLVTEQRKLTSNLATLVGFVVGGGRPVDSNGQGDERIEQLEEKLKAMEGQLMTDMDKMETWVAQYQSWANQTDKKVVSLSHLVMKDMEVSQASTPVAAGRGV